MTEKLRIRLSNESKGKHSVLTYISDKKDALDDTIREFLETDKRVIERTLNNEFYIITEEQKAYLVGRLGAIKRYLKQ